MKIKAHAKINIGLDVLGKRPDGYHEVRMIMQTVDLHDELWISKRDEPGISLTTDRDDLPVNEDNLIYKAAKLILNEYVTDGGVDIRLVKNIPVAAGLAGGSTDAAAVIKGLDEIFSLGLDADRMAELGVRIGADVPYCIMGGCALSEGIGEILTALKPFPDCGVLLAKPPISVSTAYVYNNLQPDKVTHPDIDGIMAGIEKGDIYGIAACMGNVLESVTIDRNPVVGTIKDMMSEGGAIASLMSGSGPTVFGLFDSDDKLHKAYDLIEGSGLAADLIVSHV